MREGGGGKGHVIQREFGKLAYGVKAESDGDGVGAFSAGDGEINVA